MQPRSEGRIVDLLRSNEIEPSSVGSVPNSVVYKVRVDGESDIEPLRSGKGYLKLVDDAESYRELVKANGEPPGVGLPDSIVIDDDDLAALVSAPAEGWPLSRVLPVAFLPGVWRVARAGLVSGYEAMGEHIGTLHERLAVGDRPVTTDDLEETNGLESWLSPTVRERIEEEYERAVDKTVPSARIKSDLTPHNTFYQSGDVSLIDFSLQKRPMVWETANLRVSLELMAARLPYSTVGKARRLITAFHRGYNSTVTSVDTEHLSEIFEISYLCKILKSYRRRTESASIGKRLFQKYDRRWVIDLIKRRVRSISDINEVAT